MLRAHALLRAGGPDFAVHDADRQPGHVRTAVLAYGDHDPGVVPPNEVQHSVVQHIVATPSAWCDVRLLHLGYRRPMRCRMGAASTARWAVEMGTVWVQCRQVRCEYGASCGGAAAWPTPDVFPCD